MTETETTLTERDREAVAETKAIGERLRRALPRVLLEGRGQGEHRARVSAGRAERDRAERDRIEAGYDGLDGQWHDWLETARRYEKRIPALDRADFRHDLIITLNRAQERLREPLGRLTEYRIAAVAVSNYYRERGLMQNGLDCRHCETKQRQYCRKYSAYHECKRIRPVISLEAETKGPDGEPHTLIDTLADDTAVDLDAWLDAHTFLAGCPSRLIEVAEKIVSGVTLTHAERKYLWKLRKRAQRPLF